MKCDVARLWYQYKAPVLNFIRKRVRNEELSQEILQIVFYKICNYCRTQSNVNNIASWIFQIASNTISDSYNKSHRYVLIQDNYAALNEPVDSNNQVDWLGYFLNQIPEKYAAPLQLFELGGVSQQTIADTLGATLPAIKSRVQRARKLLKERVDECGIVAFENGDVNFTPVKACCAKLTS